MWQCQSLFQADKSFELKKLALRGYYGMEYKLFGTHTMRCKAESNENLSSSVAFVKDYFYLSTAPDAAGQIKLKGDTPSVHLI